MICITLILKNKLYCNKVIVNKTKAYKKHKALLSSAGEIPLCDIT